VRILHKERWDGTRTPELEEEVYGASGLVVWWFLKVMRMFNARMRHAYSHEQSKPKRQRSLRHIYKRFLYFILAPGTLIY